MDYSEFCNYIKNHILEYMPEEFSQAEVLLDTTMKNNSVVRQCITIRTEDTNIVPKVYLEEFYLKYDYGMPIEAVCQKAAEEYQHHMVRELPFDVEMVKNFDVAKEHLTTKVVAAKNNKVLLRERPSTKLDDLAVLYQINVGKFADGTASIPVTNEIMRNWGVSISELHKIAVENTERINPSTLGSITETMFGMEENYFVSDRYTPDSPLLVLSNKDKFGGASALANQEILEKVSEVISDDYYLFPSSVHEALVLAKGIAEEMGMTPKKMGQMVREVNAVQVDKEEQLSDHIYEYNRDSKVLETVRDSKEKSMEMER